MAERFQLFNKSKYDINNWKTANIITKKETSYPHSVYGRKSIASDKKKVHKWTFKILNMQSYMYFGISSTSNQNERFCDNEESSNYCVFINADGKGMKVSRNDYKDYTLLSPDGDNTITMELNLKSKQLIYYQGSFCLGVAYDDIDVAPNIKYKMVVCFYYPESKVELIDYQSSESDLNENESKIDNHLQSSISEAADNMNGFKKENGRLPSSLSDAKDLNQENSVLKQEIEGLKLSLSDAKKQIGKLKEEGKEKDLKMIELRKEIQELRTKSMNIKKYEAWNHDQVFVWILSIEDGNRNKVFERYEAVLREKLEYQQIKGTDLADLTKPDIGDLGVAVFSHRKLLLQKIQELTNKSNANQIIAYLVK